MSQTLVLLHGWGLNRAVWDTTLPALSGQYDVHAIDIPGFGGAPWAPAFADIDTIADAVAADIRESTQHPVVLAGWSMGGLIATVIALHHPQLVERLYTVASSPCFVANPEASWPGIDGTVLSNFEAQLGTDFKATLKRFLAVQAMGSPHARQDVKTLQATVLSRPMADPAALAAGLQWLAKVDLRDQLADLSLPLHRGYGRLDSLVPLAVAEHLTTGTCTVFTSSAHAPFLNQPTEFCDWLIAPPVGG